jgi:hypothetical protein
VSYLLWLGPVAYALLQGYALWRWRGGWRAAAAVPLAVMAVLTASSLGLLAQESNLWPLPVLLASPVALLALLLLAAGHRWAHRPLPAGAAAPAGAGAGVGPDAEAERTAPPPARSGAFFAVTFLAALLGALAGVVPLFALGLVAPEVVVYALAAGVGAVFAALAGGWAATLLARDGSRTRLPAAVGFTEAAAAAAVALLLAYRGLAVRLLPRVLDVRPIVLAVGCALLLAAGATVAAWRFRSTGRYPGGDARLTLALLALAVASVPAVLFVASLFGLIGA